MSTIAGRSNLNAFRQSSRPFGHVTILTALLVVLAIAGIPFALGLFLGLVVTLTPGIERKVKVARGIAAVCHLFADEPERV